MRRFLIYICAVLTISLLTVNLPNIKPAYADFEYNVRVFVNNQEVFFPDQKPFIDSQSGRTCVPLRFVSEALGGVVGWDQDKQTASVNKSGAEILMRIGSTSPTVNGRPRIIDAAAVLMNDRAMVPLRFVSQCLGANVEWDAANRIVRITTSTPPKAEVPPGHKVTSMGYVVPSDTKIEYMDKSGDVNLRIMIVITRGDLEAQFRQAEDILAGVHGREAAKEAVDYARKKTIPEFRLDSKYFGSIRVYSGWNVPCIYIEVWREQ